MTGAKHDSVITRLPEALARISHERMTARTFFLHFITILSVMAPALAEATNTSGLPVPRFVSLKPDEVNVRTGPGTRYPIAWVYHRAGMPVEIIEEYDLWRRIRDAEGTTGWVHKTMLAGQRNVMIKGKEAHILRNDSSADAKPILKAEPSVIGKLVECEKDWCRIQLSGHKGWIEKAHLWGVYPDEKIE